MKQLNFIFSRLFTLSLMLNSMGISAQQVCTINEIQRIEADYGSPCEGDIVLLYAIRNNHANGTITWSRTDGALPSSAYVYQGQLYFSPFHNADAGNYRAVFRDNSVGCTDTDYYDLGTLIPEVKPQIQWVEDLCGSVRIKAVNLNDTTSANNIYSWLDASGSYSIHSQYTVTSEQTAQVQIVNSAGCSAEKYDYVPQTQLPYPKYDSVITTAGGGSQVCNGSVRTYSIAPQSGMSYSWIVPSGATINSGQGTTSINVTYSSSFTGGSVKATKFNQCGSVSKSINITKGTSPAKPGTISGTINGLCGLTSKTYSVTNVANITYAWTVPAGVNIMSGQGTNQITVNFSNSSNFTGNISVTATNTCATSAARTLSIKAAPATPGNISGPVTVCTGSNAAYSISPVSGASNYVWTGPSGSHITANGVTSTNNILTTPSSSVTVQFGTVTSTSTLKVKASNSCASSAVKSLALSPCPPRLMSQEAGLIRAYPNPASEQITVEVHGITADENGRLSIYDMIGKKWLDQSITVEEGMNHFTLDLKGISKGNYLLQLVTGEENYTIRFIKE